MTKSDKDKTQTEDLSEYGLLPGETFSGFVDLRLDEDPKVNTIVPNKYRAATCGRILMGDLTVYVIWSDATSTVTFYKSPDDRVPFDMKLIEHNLKKFPKSFGLMKIAPDTKHLLATVDTLCRTLGPNHEVHMLEYILYQVLTGDFPEGSYPTTIVIDCTEPDNALKIQHYSVPTLYWSMDGLFLALLYVRLDIGLDINVATVRAIADIRNTWDMQSKLIITHHEEDINVETISDGSSEILCNGGNDKSFAVNWNSMKHDKIVIRTVTEEDIQTVIAYLGISKQTLN